MHKCACGEHIKHVFFISEQIHAFQTRYVYIGLSDICILCSQHVLAFICMFYWHRLPIAELDRYYVQHGRENQIQSRNL